MGWQRLGQTLLPHADLRATCVVLDDRRLGEVARVRGGDSDGLSACPGPVGSSLAGVEFSTRLRVLEGAAARR